MSDDEFQCLCTFSKCFCPGSRKNLPEPICKNRSRSTMKCRKSCCRKKVEPQPNNTRQFQMSWIGIGDFCELGCCDFSDKYASHSCQRPKSP